MEPTTQGFEEIRVTATLQPIAGLRSSQEPDRAAMCKRTCL